MANAVLGGEDPPSAALARATHGVFLLVAVVIVVMALCVAALSGTRTHLLADHPAA